MEYRLKFPASARNRESAPHPLTELAGWTVIAALVFAPASLGCVRPWAITGLEILLTAAVVLWLAGCFAEKRRPRLPPLYLVLCCLIVLQGCGAILFALLRNPPGVVPVSVMADSLLRVTALLGALLLTCDLAGSHSHWHERLWWAMALTGAAVSLFGILQKTGLTDLAARFMESQEGIYFATFNYHGNAGAFLNIITLLCAGRVLLEARRPRPDPKAVLIPAMLLFFCIAGALVNVSRAAQAILCLLLALFTAVAFLCRDRPRIPRRPRTAVSDSRSLLLAGIGIVALVTAVSLFRGSGSAKRWRALGGMIASDRNSRTILAKTTLPMAAEAGAWGSGPGSYKILFPRSPHLRPELYANFIVTEYVPGRRISMWSNAHNDYLQTVIEWGWIGSITWGALLLAGPGRLLFCAFLPLLSPPGAAGRILSEEAVFRLSAGLALLGMCLHALVDFPFQIASLQLYAAVLLGIAWQNRGRTPESQKSSGIISRLRRIL